MNRELDKLHQSLNGVVIDFQDFPWPNRLGKRDEKRIGDWLKAIGTRLQKLDNELYAAAKAGT